MIAGPRQGRLYSARVAMQAARVNLQGEGHFARLDRLGIHIPHVLLAIPVDGALEPKTSLFKKVGSSAMPRAYKVLKLLLALQIQSSRRVGSLVTEPGAAISQEKTVVNAGRAMSELSRQQAFPGVSARIRHWSCPITLINGLMTFRADCIGVRCRRRSSCRSCRRGGRQPKESEQQASQWKQNTSQHLDLWRRRQLCDLPGGEISPKLVPDHF